MTAKLMKIIFLISLISIFFFPFLASAGIREDIKSALEEKGLEVISVSEPDVLVPDQGITFELKNADKLKPGKNRLVMDLFYHQTAYLTASVEVRLAGTINIEPRTERSFRTADDPGRWVVRKGDRVTLLFKKDGLIIKTEGKALENGKKNDRVSALNRFCNKTVTGLVLDGRNIEICD